MQPIATERFGDRVDDYRRYRPSYPAGAVDAVCARLTQPHPEIADLGAGTGVFTALLLERGCVVHAVEPNAPMRAAAEADLAAREGFHSVAATAEETTLPAASVDAITAAQAFHWFDRDRARGECARILRPKGCVFIVFNERLVDTTPFLKEYETLLLNLGTDYGKVDHRRIDRDALGAFYGHDAFEERTFEYAQVFDWDGLAGRARSSSYVPAPGQPGHADFMNALRTLYDTHQEGGTVSFQYNTRVYAGQLA